MNSRPVPTALIILDGWGYREETANNAIANANTPTWDRLLSDYPNTLIQTSGEAVGLPDGAIIEEHPKSDRGMGMLKDQKLNGDKGVGRHDCVGVTLS